MRVAADTILINAIEDAAVALVRERLEQARKVAVQKGVTGIPDPGVYCSVESGTFERVTASRWKQTLTMYVDLVFVNLQSQERRREGVNLILDGVLRLLLNNVLGLDITPLAPRVWRNTTTTEMDGKGLITYSLELTTSCSLAWTDPEEVFDLLAVGLDYYLQEPADDAADAADLVTLGTGEPQ